MSKIEEFNEAYKEIRPTLYNNFILTAKSIKVLSDIDVAVAETTQASYELSGAKEELGIEKVKDTSYYNIFEFINLTNLSAYKHLSNIDIDRLNAKEYGYDKCFESMGALLSYSNSGGQSGGVEESILNDLLSVQRGISCSDYLNQDKYMDDIENIRQLLESPGKHTEYSDEILDLLDRDTYFSGLIKSRLQTIRKRYSYIMEGAFGIDHYKGVYTCQKNGAFVGVKSTGGVKIIEPDEDLSDVYAKNLNEILKLKPAHEYSQGYETQDGEKRINTSGRQFDKNLIFRAYQDSSINEPLYFPFKILEIIAKCQPTVKTQMLNYRRLSASKAGSLDKYLDMLLDGFANDMLEYIHIAVVNYIYSKERVSGEELFNKTITILKSKDVDYYESMKSYAELALNYYVQCVTTAVVLDRLEVGKERTIRGEKTEILDFRIKVSSELKVDSSYDNIDYIESLRNAYSKTKDEYQGVESYPAIEDDRGMFRLDLFYTFNADKVNARPVFAYKALEKLQQQQDSDDSVPVLDWSNILLGNSTSNNLVISKPNGSINLQDHKCHFIIAGSRSGKGVMCYNIFATAIASGIPIFYLDAKPDTATVMKALNPNIFAFNGGEWDESMDLSKSFAPSNYTFQIPTYFTSCFAEEKDKFNLAYFKAAYMYYTMFWYLDKCTGVHRDHLSELLSKGAILVMDEFTEYANDFLKDKKLWASDGALFSKALTAHAIQKFMKQARNTRSKLKGDIKKEGSKGEKADEEKIADLNQDLNNVGKESELSIINLYATSIAEYYKEMLEKTSSLTNKSGANWKKIQTFIIGQDLNVFSSALKAKKTNGGKDEVADWFNQSSTGVNLFITSRGSVPLIHVFKYLTPDFIMGYQPNREEYLAQTKNMRMANNVNASKRCFAYKACGNLNYKDIDAIMDSASNYALTGAKTLEDYLNNWHIFKPFLILNNSVTPYDEFPDSAEEDIIKIFDNKDLSNDDREAICKGKQAAASGSVYSKSQYLNQTIFYSGKAGITWSDIVADNPPADGEAVINRGIGFDTYLERLSSGSGVNAIEGLGKSGEIANYFVQNVYGYNGTWEDYICDFRPEWFIKFSDLNQDGTVKPVQERLNTTFFNQDLLDNGFGEIFGGMTESLTPYYTSNESFGEVTNIMPEVEDSPDIENVMPEIEDSPDIENVMPEIENSSVEEENIITGVAEEGVTRFENSTVEEVSQQIINNRSAINNSRRPEDDIMTLRDANGNPINPIHLENNNKTARITRQNNGVVQNTERRAVQNTERGVVQNTEQEVISDTRIPMNTHYNAPIQNIERRQMQFTNSLGVDNRPEITFDDFMAILMQLHGRDVKYTLDELRTIYSHVSSCLSERFKFGF